MKFCGKCGAPCDDAYKHCPECGAPLSDSETNADLNNHTTDSTNNAEQTDTGNSNHMHENPFMTAYTAPEDASADSPSDTHTSENSEGTSSNAVTENAASHSDEHASENTYTQILPVRLIIQPKMRMHTATLILPTKKRQLLIITAIPIITIPIIIIITIPTIIIREIMHIMPTILMEIPVIITIFSKILLSRHETFRFV